MHNAYRSTGPFTTDKEKYLAVNLILVAANWRFWASGMTEKFAAGCPLYASEIL